MRLLFLIFVILWLLSPARAGVDDKVRIAVIDNGFKNVKVELCNKEVVTLSGSPGHEYREHGSLMVKLIEEQRNVPVCYILIDVFNNKGEATPSDVARGVLKAIELKADIINLSLGSWDVSSIEQLMVEEAIKEKIIIVAAAGNQGIKSKKCQYYPASYDKKIVMVSNKHIRANDCEDVDYYIDGDIGGEWKGTSVSTALITGILTNNLKKHKEDIYGK